MLQVRPLTTAQPHLTAAVNCKHILENTDHYIVEVEMYNEGDIFESFQWLKISKDLKLVKLLNLTAVDSSREVEERFFSEGYLKFNNSNGIFIEKFNSGQHEYQLRGSEIENMLSPTLQRYFFEDKSLVN